MQTHVHPRASTHVCAYMCECVCAQVCLHVHAHRCTHMHTHKHAASLCIHKSHVVLFLLHVSSSFSKQVKRTRQGSHHLTLIIQNKHRFSLDRRLCSVILLHQACRPRSVRLRAKSSERRTQSSVQKRVPRVTPNRWHHCYSAATPSHSHI